MRAAYLDVMALGEDKCPSLSLEDLPVIFSVEYLYYLFSGVTSTNRFLSMACIIMSQCSGYARFELQIDNIPHG